MLKLFCSLFLVTLFDSRTVNRREEKGNIVGSSLPPNPHHCVITSRWTFPTAPRSMHTLKTPEKTEQAGLYLQHTQSKAKLKSRLQTQRRASAHSLIPLGAKHLLSAPVPCYSSPECSCCKDGQDPVSRTNPRHFAVVKEEGRQEEEGVFPLLPLFTDDKT